MTLHIIAANKLDSGLVVYLGKNNVWTGDIQKASLAQTETEAKDTLHQMLSTEKAAEVVGASAISVDFHNKKITPLQYKERLRALGPSVRPDLGYQANGDT